jgi:hypothetical protein
MSKARRAGEFPSAAELRRNPEAGIRAIIAREDREMQEFERTRNLSGTGGPDSQRTRANAKTHDAEAKRWSDEHSRQKSTRFNPRWSAAKKERYYQTFVRPWGEKRTPEQLAAYREWQEESGIEYDRDDPYRQ